MVAQQHHNVTLYVECLSCLLERWMDPRVGVDVAESKHISALRDGNQNIFPFSFKLFGVLTVRLT